MNSPRLVRLLALLLALMGLGLAGCSKESEAAKVPVVAKVAPEDLKPLGLAPAWKLKDVDGKEIDSSQFKGKVVVVDFWATWCGPCVKEIPGYTDLQRKYGKDGLAIVGISLDEAGPAVVKAFVAKYGVNYQIVMGDDAVQTAFAAAGGVIDAIPATFLIDRDGQIRDRKRGVEEAAVYEQKILALLK